MQKYIGCVAKNVLAFFVRQPIYIPYLVKQQLRYANWGENNKKSTNKLFMNEYRQIEKLWKIYVRNDLILGNIDLVFKIWNKVSMKCLR